MSIEYYTEIEVNGTPDECTRMVQYLQHYFEESGKQQFGKFHVLSQEQYQALLDKAATGHVALGMEGPLCGPFLLDDIEIFKSMAEEVPTCSFYGRMQGEDPGSEQSLRAKLEDGLLYQWFDYHSYDDEWDDEYADYDDEYSDYEEVCIPLFAEPMNAEKKEDTKSWGTPYDPVKKVFITLPEENVTAHEEHVRFEVHMKYEYRSENGKAGFYVDSESYEQPLTLRCYPEELLKQETPGEFLDLLAKAVDGKGADKVREAILGQKERIIGSASEGMMTAAKITLIHDHQDPILFEMLDPKLKTFCKKVCESDESNREKCENKLLRFLKKYAPELIKTEDEGPSAAVWPTLCLYHPELQEDGTRILVKNPKASVKPMISWGFDTSDLRKFAAKMCAENPPGTKATEIIELAYFGGKPTDYSARITFL